MGWQVEDLVTNPMFFLFTFSLSTSPFTPHPGGYFYLRFSCSKAVNGLLDPSTKALEIYNPTDSDIELDGSMHNTASLSLHSSFLSSMYLPSISINVDLPLVIQQYNNIFRI